MRSDIDGWTGETVASCTLPQRPEYRCRNYHHVCEIDFLSQELCAHESVHDCGAPGCKYCGILQANNLWVETCCAPICDIGPHVVRLTERLRYLDGLASGPRPQCYFCAPLTVDCGHFGHIRDPKLVLPPSICICICMTANIDSRQ